MGNDNPGEIDFDAQFADDDKLVDEAEEHVHNPSKSYVTHRT
ncbi:MULTISPECIES: hypothetical protein [Halobacterium]|uniref:Uncharacterized protein n=3 Tax=Halobacterium salinarum TaxID=2242 RepID=Q9HSQ9_HALSA|nr:MULTISPECIES: hypothetical protein [Halobacterium]AAG18744.1 hypothetical protein VNG_0120H [Halobacterium salinarum NRC-1]MBB6090979.1 hypothetical protein [Halobacterium salinarum]CAP13001.1 uncharacterized protein OE_1198R [Halobacterium salinarum R1]DAC77432.1 TPA_inf: uncharacterized protein VNG_0120H [Halobacterium salinarum NRC-1]